MKRGARLLLTPALALALAACQTSSKKPTTAPAAASPAPAAPAVVRVIPPIVMPAEPAAAAKPDPAVVPERTTGAEIFARLRARLDQPSCVSGAHNRGWRKRYAGYPENFSRQIQDILPLLDYALREIEKADLPGEFALIPIVESWYRPGVRGPGGPSGMWQMIASTARNHGVVIISGYDGRFSPVESTRAAVSYLETIDDHFEGDWRATAMGYNAGEFRVIRALRNNSRVHGEKRQPRGLSSVTYAYIDKLRALSCLISEPGKHGLELPMDMAVEPLVAARLPAGAHSLDAAARALDMDAQRLRQLNPAFANGRVVAGAPRDLLVPRHTRPHWDALAALSPSPKPSVAAAGTAHTNGAKAPSAKSHTVRSGESLWTIARRYRVKLVDLRVWNSLIGSSVLQPGQRLKLQP